MARPAGVALLGAFLILVGLSLVLLVLGWTYGWEVYAQVAPPGSPLALAFDALGIAFAVLLIAVATIATLSGVGVYDGREWAWPLAFGIAAAEGGLGVAIAAIGPGSPQRAVGALAFAVSAAVVLYLTRPGVRRWFGRA
jgi:hypothetical protein